MVIICRVLRDSTSHHHHQVYSSFKEWLKLPTCAEESKNRSDKEAKFRCVGGGGGMQCQGGECQVRLVIRSSHFPLLALS